MNTKIQILLSTTLFLISNIAYAGCGPGYVNQTGYIYVYKSCLQEELYSGKPENSCQVAKGEKAKTVLFYSNVIFDDGANNRYPASQYFDEIQIQHNLTLNGEISYCYPTRDEALDAKRKEMADWKRGSSSVIFKRVHMDNT